MFLVYEFDSLMELHVHSSYIDLHLVSWLAKPLISARSDDLVCLKCDVFTTWSQIPRLVGAILYENVHLFCLNHDIHN